MKKRIIKLFTLLVVVLSLFESPANAQVLSGASFLRSLPGARLQAMSSSATAGLDVIHALYANPGVAGFMREWQWSAGYTKWIADVYNASFVYGRRIRMPWSQQSRFVLGVLYQGVNEFDSSDGATPMVNANDMVLTAGLGQPLTFLSQWVSFGVQAKYFRSTLDQFNASSFMGDFGLFYRTPNFPMPLNGLGIFESGIFSTGLSLVNVGSSLTYISVETPLPRAVRGGIALNVGTHNGFQTQFAIDFLKYDNEKSAVNFGLEFSWNRLLAITTGYQKDIGLIDQATFGLSVNLDDLRMPTGSPFPGRNNALRLDLASLEEGEFFSRTYRGNLSHYVIGPESFQLEFPAQHQTINQDSLTLRWEPSKDPDLYDHVNYYLLVSRDSALVASALTELKYGQVSVSSIPQKEGLIVSQQVTGAGFALQNLAGGDYYWSIIAFDSDDHYKISETNGNQIYHFYIPLPDLLVESIQFEYFPWITTDEYQGKLKVVVRNNGSVPANKFMIFFHDSVTVPINNPPDQESWTHTGFMPVDKLAAGGVDTVSLDWYRVTMGLCRIAVTADAEEQIRELNEDNNQHVEYFYTIPKGTFTTGDVNRILAFQKAITEKPVINEVNFAVNSSQVPQLYLEHPDFAPPLAVISSRMKEHNEIKISIQGFADSNSENATVQLANERAQAVRQTLLSLGVPEDQITMREGRVLPKRRVPVKEEDKRWVFEERRKVEIYLVNDPDNLLYEPVPDIFEGQAAYPLTFDSQIRAAIPAKKWAVHLGQDANLFDYDLDSNKLADKIGVEWTKTDSVAFVNLLGQNLQYAITLTDSLGRTFKTKPQQTRVVKEEALTEHRFSFPLKFDDTHLLYNDYWQRVFEFGLQYFDNPSMKLRFDGHADATGPAEYNLILSKRRAVAMKKNYTDYVRKEKPGAIETVNRHLDQSADGYGEEKPFELVQTFQPNKVIGDNEIAIGRKHNRRIDIIYYVPEK